MDFIMEYSAIALVLPAAPTLQKMLDQLKPSERYIKILHIDRSRQTECITQEMDDTSTTSSSNIKFITSEVCDEIITTYWFITSFGNIYCFTVDPQVNGRIRLRKYYMANRVLTNLAMSAIRNSCGTTENLLVLIKLIRNSMPREWLTVEPREASFT